MKKALSIAFLLVFGTIWSQNNEFSFDSVQHVFWKISHPKSKNVSYLFGTLHAIEKDLFILPKSVEKKIARADVFYLELSDFENEKQALELSIMENGRMTDYLSKPQRDSVYTYCQTLWNMDSTQFENTFGRFKPVVFSQLDLSKNLSNTISVDRVLYQIAVDKKVKNAGLETIREQLSYFDDLSDEMQVNLIMQNVRNQPNSLEEWYNMQALYLNQSLSELMTMMDGGESLSEFTNTVLIEERNRKWVSFLEPELLQNNLFIAVGAGHLPSKTGLLSLLTDKGYLVEPIDIQIKK